MTAALGSVIIAAHNEEQVIDRVLDHLAEAVSTGQAEVIVVCNGCQDRTAEIARTHPGVQVVELPVPSKTGALREGDRRAGPGPRIYLDADVELTSRAAVATLRALGGGGEDGGGRAVAGRPPHRFDTSRSGLLVRRWYAVRVRLPSISRALWGAGCYALSVEGRGRFGEFPEVVADDLFIDGLFARDEITIVDTDPVVVHPPRTTASLVTILRRKYRSQPPDRDGGTGVVLSGGQRGQLRDLAALVRSEPARAADAAVYAALITLARLRSTLGPAPRWERDDSSRVTE